MREIDPNCPLCKGTGFIGWFRCRLCNKKSSSEVTNNATVAPSQRATKARDEWLERNGGIDAVMRKMTHPLIGDAE